MSDLISRKSAIEALRRAEALTRAFGYHNVVDTIRELPSAQPEIIWCKECKYQRKGQNECEAWNLCGYRPWQYTPITDEHFCSYAERRTDE